MALERLRHALVGPDRERITKLESPEAAAAVLPEVVAHATKTREEDLGVALEPVVTRAVTAVAKRRPELYAEILAPTIGATVRKAVADAVAAMLERFDAALERSLSVHAIRWRIEAKRTGRPFAEVVLLRTLQYRIEQVLLIHGETSLVLQHLIDPTLPPVAADQVAAMLSAIDSFGREAFGPMSPGSHLSRFELGELSVWVATAPPITLAAVVRGAAPATTADVLREALARVRVTCDADLTAFVGDVTRFEAARPLLEPLLHAERVAAPRRAKPILLVLAAIVVAALVGLGLKVRAERRELARRQAAYVSALEREPGIVVETADAAHHRFAGLRDPLAPEPAAVIAREGLAPAQLRFIPFSSLDPRIVERRARMALAPPPGVEVSLAEGTLHLRGTAPRRWIDDAKLLARALPGVDRLDAAVRSEESVETLRDASAALDAARVPFALGRAALDGTAEATVRGARETMARAFAAADDAGIAACVALVGHADPSGSDAQNLTLSKARAETVMRALADRGVDPARLRVEDRGALDPPRAAVVTFQLEIDETRTAGSPCGAAP